MVNEYEVCRECYEVHQDIMRELDGQAMALTVVVLLAIVTVITVGLINAY